MRSAGDRGLTGRVRRLPRSFYDRPTLDVAHDLLGKVLVHRRGSVTSSGAIVEVEAYIGESDPACHAAAGRTKRNDPLYGPPGFAYVYLSYGLHCLVNIVTECEGSPAAVLIRALDPIDGAPAMRRRRALETKRRQPGTRFGKADCVLCQGPGNLTMAMGITLAQNRVDLGGDTLYVEDRGREPGQIAWGPRIGISAGTDRPWRAWVVGHPAVSGRRRASGDLTPGAEGSTS
jgi:DNA-3-methyladenine glycosylase